MAEANRLRFCCVARSVGGLENNEFVYLSISKKAKKMENRIELLLFAIDYPWVFGGNAEEGKEKSCWLKAWKRLTSTC